ncbi:hypothetical protein Wenmar_02740 [Wenxinia marina DSM 24838]|uniref:Uncharacterized protein n=1 Tax=Wenxinia marina DSM 24838 TaxID=1123501 RepID=A0A0D0NJG1_9RHOB|nr:hypothetical protein Wenmar_02740 [Wenxinia marina DSM 24838]
MSLADKARRNREAALEAVRCRRTNIFHVEPVRARR